MKIIISKLTYELMKNENIGIKPLCWRMIYIFNVDMEQIKLINYIKSLAKLLGLGGTLKKKFSSSKPKPNF